MSNLHLPVLCDSDSLTRVIDWLYDNSLAEYEILFRTLKINEFELAYRWEPSDIYRILKIRIPRHFNAIVRHKYELLFCIGPDLKQNQIIKNKQNNMSEEENKSPVIVDSNKEIHEKKYNSNNRTGDKNNNSEPHFQKATYNSTKRCSSNSSNGCNTSTNNNSGLDICDPDYAEALVHARSYGHQHIAHPLHIGCNPHSNQQEPNIYPRKNSIHSVKEFLEEESC